MVSRDPNTGRFVSERALPREVPDPRDRPPNENDPLPSVGPNVPAGFGDTHVMYPSGSIVPEAWQGWPVSWGTGWSNTGGTDWLRRLDIVFSCLDRNSGPLSTFPPYLQRDGQKLPDLSREWLLNPEPLAYTSWVEFMRQLVWLFQSAGEVFVVATARGDDGYPSRFIAIEPWLVDVQKEGGRLKYTINQTPVPADDVCHLKYLSFPSDLRGHGPLEAAGARLLIAEALAKYAADLASNGGAPWAVLKATRTLTAAQSQRLQSQWMASRLRAGGAPAVLDSDTDIEVLSGNPKDMMLDELARFSESRIAVLLGVPPHLVGLPSGGDSLTYSTVTMMYDAHWRGTLRVIGKFISAGLNSWLSADAISLEFDADAYTQPPTLERAQTYEILLRAGVITVDEARAREHMGPLPADAVPTSPPALVSVPSEEAVQ